MRDPASPKGVNSPDIRIAVGSPAVSIPDRRRIDSDVRAFLREPSTPWIVFDREGRPPSQLAVGEVLEVPRRSLLSFADPSMFPSTAIIDAAAGSRAEPSSLAVAADLEAEDAASSGQDPVGDEAHLPGSRLGRRAVGALVAAAALVVTVAVGAGVVRASALDDAPRNVATTQLAARSFGAALPADLPPPELDVAVPTTTADRAATPDGPEAAAASDTPKKLARLSLTGAARSQSVFFDGKRMLGRGARSFTVVCGPHTIAVGRRSEVRDVEIPCTGTARFVVSK
jgi:hypothetical protein